MLWILLLVSALAFFVLLGLSEKFDLENFALLAGGIFLVSLASLIVCAALGSITIDEYEEKTSETAIVSLQDNSLTSGHGTYHHMLISTVGGYTYYYEADDNALMQNTVSAEETKLYPQDVCENPRIIEYTTYEVSILGENLSKFFLGFDTDSIRFRKRYEIYVPKTAIIEEFELDGKF